MALQSHVKSADGNTVAVLRHDDTHGEAFREGFVRRIVHTGGLMSVILDIHNGPWEQPDPLHSHPHEQIAFISSGEVLFLIEGREPVRLSAGDIVAIPPNVPHGIQLLSKTARLVDSFTPIRDDFLPAK